MAFISYVPEQAAGSELKKLYQKYRGSDGNLDNILKIHSHNPRSMRAHFELYSWLMRGKSELSRLPREMVAVVVSALNHCHY